MSKIHVTAQRDFLESLTKSKPLDGLAEIIWNGFDANASHVQVFLEFNEMNGIESIKVRDDGYGVAREKVESYFGHLGASWKKAEIRQNGRSLHGKNGKGRFKAFGLGEQVEWNTSYAQNGKIFSYKIKGRAQSLDDFDISDPFESNSAIVGTEVSITNLSKDFRSLGVDYAPQELAKKFAAYLTEYSNLRLEYNGKKIDPSTAQTYHRNYPLGEFLLSDGRSVSAEVSVIEWNIASERSIHLCDAKGISLYELAGQKIRAPGFNFTVYLKSEFFRDLDSKNQLVLTDLDADVQRIVTAAKNKTKEHFRLRLLEKQSKTIDRWKTEHIYPYEEKSNLDPVEIAERQVFDILAVNVESYLPSFDDADEKSKKFTFRLLAQAIKDNPDSVQKIIGEVLGLKKADQDDLAELLKKTSLSSIISSAKIVANRLDFLNGLEELIFDKENKKKLLERDQLHKILENESWIFSEEFSLAGSEKSLNDVLSQYLEKLGKREDDPAPVVVGDNKTGRVDLLLHKAIQPRTGEYDYLVVELKRPSKKIDGEVLTQIKQYANAVAKDERFRDVPTRWTVIAISNDMTEDAKIDANQRNRPRGMILDNPDQNITVWAKTWAEVINDARARLHFVKDQLAYEADSDSAKTYLNKAHAKFIPNIES
jgi:Histidine kinase-, DNA gyrase B-, and HSP90-like ATPase